MCRQSSRSRTGCNSSSSLMVTVMHSFYRYATLTLLNWVKCSESLPSLLGATQSHSRKWSKSQSWVKESRKYINYAFFSTEKSEKCTLIQYFIPAYRQWPDKEGSLEESGSSSVGPFTEKQQSFLLLIRGETLRQSLVCFLVASCNIDVFIRKGLKYKVNNICHTTSFSVCTTSNLIQCLLF